jgi:hypothetical protein
MWRSSAGKILQARWPSVVNKVFDPTDEQRKSVEAMAGYGIPVEDMAKMVINPNTGEAVCKATMYNKFKNELSVGMTKANAKIAESLYRQATGGNTTAAIWWSKARMGWKETQKQEVDGGITVKWLDGNS